MIYMHCFVVSRDSSGVSSDFESISLREVD